MNVIFICVIVLDKMCFHMLNICWFKQRFLSILVVFGKYFVLTKTENFKNSVSLFWRLSRGSVKSHATIASSGISFGDLFASGRSSREGYTEIFAAQLATSSWVRFSIAKNTLANFSNLLAWSVLAGDFGDFLTTHLNPKKCVFCIVKAVFKIFFNFPYNFYDYSLSLSTVSFPHTPCHPLRTPFLLHFNSKSSRKRYGFSFSHSIFFVFELFPLDYMCWYSDLCWVGDSVLCFVLVWHVEDLGLYELV